MLLSGSSWWSSSGSQAEEARLAEEVRLAAEVEERRAVERLVEEARWALQWRKERKHQRYN